MEDEQIIDLYWARNEDAISETASKYGSYCFHISCTILGFQDAEECVNESYLHLWNAIPPQRPNPLKTFLGKITRNLSLQRWQKLHAQKRGGGQVAIALEELEECVSNSDSEEIADRLSIQNAVNQFLIALPKEARILFVLRYWHLYSIDEIHQRTGFSENKIKSSLHRSRKMLRSRLESEGITI